MVKSVFLNVSSLVLSGIIFLGSVYGCDEDFRDRKTASSGGAKSSESFFEEGEDAIEVFLRPGFAQALDCMNQFVGAVEKKNYVLAAQSYEKALEYYPAIKFPKETYLIRIYMDLSKSSTTSGEKELYIQKAREVIAKCMPKKEGFSVDEWRSVRDFALAQDNLDELSQANDKIMSVIGNPSKIEDVVPLFFQFHRQGLYGKAHEMLRIVLKNRKAREALKGVSHHVAMVCFELCVFTQDYESVCHVLSCITDKKAFFEKEELLLYHAYHAYLESNDYKNVLSLMKTFSKRDNLTDLKMIACLSELEKDYKEALVARERMIELDSSRASYEEFLAFCERAAKVMRTTSQKKPFLDRAKKIGQILASMESDSGAASSSDKRHSAPTAHDVGFVLRGLVANKHMDSASQLIASLPSEEWPECVELREEVILNFKQCQMIYERICSGDTSINVSNMYAHVEKMRTALKKLGTEKEKSIFRRRRVLVTSSSTDSSPVLIPAQPVNLRKEVLEAHGLSQKREKPVDGSEFDGPTIAPFPLEPEEDTPYAIEWVWTHKSQKEKEGLSSGAQAKLDLFMEEVTMNPFSVRRDGSLASGEPRHIVGYGPNTYERDMDVYNRFIYSVIATGPKSVKVLVLGVQGHL